MTSVVHVGVAHLPVPSEAALISVLHISHIVVPVVIDVVRIVITHRGIVGIHLTSINSHSSAILIASLSQLSIESVVELVVSVVVEVELSQFGEVHLISTNSGKVGNNCSVQQ